jgi:hypothetical protein
MPLWRREDTDASRSPDTLSRVGSGCALAAAVLGFFIVTAVHAEARAATLRLNPIPTKEVIDARHP